MEIFPRAAIGYQRIYRHESGDRQTGSGGKSGSIRGNIMRSMLLCSAALIGAASFTVPAQAQIVGSASLATHRSCATTLPTANCDGAGPGQQIVDRRYGGGVGLGGGNALFVGANQAWSNVTFDAMSDLPIIRAYTAAPGNVRMNINAFAFQSFTYSGPAGTPFSITGDLHIVDSSASPDGGARPNGAIYSQYVAVWDPSALAGLSTAEELFNALFYAPCGTAGVLGASAVGGGTLTGGELNATSTTVACAPGSLTLTPGQEVLVVAGLQLPVNRGGFADATSTFRTRLGDDLAPEVKAQLTQSLVSASDRGALAAVPEPATWAMMIAGFGFVGAATRRRAQVVLA
jgi:hypothetical protein